MTSNGKMVSFMRHGKYISAMKNEWPLMVVFQESTNINMCSKEMYPPSFKICGLNSNICLRTCWLMMHVLNAKIIGIGFVIGDIQHNTLMFINPNNNFKRSSTLQLHASSMAWTRNFKEFIKWKPSRTLSKKKEKRL